MHEKDGGDKITDEQRRRDWIALQRASLPFSLSFDGPSSGESEEQASGNYELVMESKRLFGATLCLPAHSADLSDTCL